MSNSPAGAGLTAQNLSDHALYQNPSQDCDVVMKGGITSGVIYPRAVCKLATIRVQVR